MYILYTSNSCIYFFFCIIYSLSLFYFLSLHFLGVKFSIFSRIITVSFRINVNIYYISLYFPKGKRKVSFTYFLPINSLFPNDSLHFLSCPRFFSTVYTPFFFSFQPSYLHFWHCHSTFTLICSFSFFMFVQIILLLTLFFHFNIFSRFLSYLSTMRFLCYLGFTFLNRHCSQDFHFFINLHLQHSLST